MAHGATLVPAAPSAPLAATYTAPAPAEEVTVVVPSPPVNPPPVWLAVMTWVPLLVGVKATEPVVEPGAITMGEGKAVPSESRGVMVSVEDSPEPPVSVAVTVVGEPVATVEGEAARLYPVALAEVAANEAAPSPPVKPPPVWVAVTLWVPATEGVIVAEPVVDPLLIVIVPETAPARLSSRVITSGEERAEPPESVAVTVEGEPTATDVGLATSVNPVALAAAGRAEVWLVVTVAAAESVAISL